MHRSNPGTPTQPRRPDFIGVNPNVNQPGAPAYYDFPMHQVLPSQPHHLQQQQQQMQQHQQQMAMHHNGSGPRAQQTNTAYGSPQRRFLSEGELVRQSNEMSYARSNNTVDNIRELAGSPQHGVYMWKDNSPGYSAVNAIGNHQPPPFPGQQQQQQQNLINRQLQSSISQPHHDYNNSQLQQQQHSDPYNHHRSNPTSPTQQMQQYGGGVNPQAMAAAAIGQRYQQQQQLLQAAGNTNGQPNGTAGTYHPALRGGVPVFPPQPSPQIKRKATPTRPISFVRALEMTDSMEMTAMSGSSNDPQTQQQQQQIVQQSRSNNGPVIGGANQPPNNLQRSTTPTPDRASVYDMNYEISV